MTGLAGGASAPAGDCRAKRAEGTGTRTEDRGTQTGCPTMGVRTGVSEHGLSEQTVRTVATQTVGHTWHYARSEVRRTRHKEVQGGAPRRGARRQHVLPVGRASHWIQHVSWYDTSSCTMYWEVQTGTTQCYSTDAQHIRHRCAMQSPTTER